MLHLAYKAPVIQCLQGSLLSKVKLHYHGVAWGRCKMPYPVRT